MTEHARLIGRILAVAHEFADLEAFYWPDSRQAIRRGWPDLAVIGPHGQLFREVKTAFGVLSAEQRQLGYLMEAGALNWAVWRPRDLASGRVRAECQEISAWGRRNRNI